MGEETELSLSFHSLTFCRNRNCRFKFVTSIVSKSMTSMVRNPDIARSFRSSHPRPPAPITRIFEVRRDDVDEDGSCSPIGRAPLSEL